MWSGWLSSILLSYTTRLELLLCYCILGGLYLYCVAKGTKAGTTQRTLASLPILFGNVFIPFIFDPEKEVCTAMAVCFLLTWLGTFKVRDEHHANLFYIGKTWGGTMSHVYWL